MHHTHDWGFGGLLYSQNGSIVPNFETLIGNFEVKNET